MQIYGIFEGFPLYKYLGWEGVERFAAGKWKNATTSQLHMQLQ